MKRIPWPNYFLSASMPTEPIEWQSMSVQIEYPGREVQKGRYTTKELTWTRSEGEFSGSIMFPIRKRNSEAHIETEKFIRTMLDDPQNNYTLLPWDKPSIFTRNSTLESADAISRIGTPDNSAVANLALVQGTWIFTITPGTGNDNFVLSPGEHFGFDEKTFMIDTATPVQGSPGNFHIEFLPNTYDATSGLVYKRNFLPVRFRGNNSIPDTLNGSVAGGYSVEVVEHNVN